MTRIWILKKLLEKAEFIYPPSWPLPLNNLILFMIGMLCAATVNIAAVYSFLSEITNTIDAFCDESAAKRYHAFSSAVLLL